MRRNAVKGTTMRLETLAIHADEGQDPHTGAVVPPITLSTTFLRAEDGSYPSGNVYTRAGNPNRNGLERTLAALEGGAAAAAFASGQAASYAIFQTLQPGDHVIAPAVAYHGTLSSLRDVLSRWQLEFSLVDMSNPDAVRAALRPNTRMIFGETPANPMLTICDLEAITEIGHQHGALVVVDNTWATPVAQNPFQYGVDLVMHSTTKYIGGHSDVLGGAVIAREANELFERIRLIQSIGGGVPSPFDCWLLLRGIRTLPYRVRAHSENAIKVAQFLYDHPMIERVLYPGLPDHPGHEIAARQMRYFGGMLSCQVVGGPENARRVASRTKLFAQATSLGGTESLIEHRASVEGPYTTTPHNLLRISVGLEHPDDLIEDLAAALATI